MFGAVKAGCVQRAEEYYALAGPNTRPAGTRSRWYPCMFGDVRGVYWDWNVLKNLIDDLPPDGRVGYPARQVTAEAAWADVDNSYAVDHK